MGNNFEEHIPIREIIEMDNDYFLDKSLSQNVNLINKYYLNFMDAIAYIRGATIITIILILIFGYVGLLSLILIIIAVTNLGYKKDKLTDAIRIFKKNMELYRKDNVLTGKQKTIFEENFKKIKNKKLLESPLFF